MLRLQHFSVWLFHPQQHVWLRLAEFHAENIELLTLSIDCSPYKYRIACRNVAAAAVVTPCCPAPVSAITRGFGPSVSLNKNLAENIIKFVRTLND